MPAGEGRLVVPVANDASSSFAALSSSLPSLANGPQDLEVHSSPAPPRWNRVRGASRGDRGHRAGWQCSSTLRCGRRFYPIHGGRGVSQPRRVFIPLPVVPGVAMSLAAAAGARRSCRAGPRPPLEPHGQPPARASTGSLTMAKVPFIGFPVGVIRHPSPRSNAVSCA